MDTTADGAGLEGECVVGVWFWTCWVWNVCWLSKKSRWIGNLTHSSGAEGKAPDWRLEYGSPLWQMAFGAEELGRGLDQEETQGLTPGALLHRGARDRQYFFSAPYADENEAARPRSRWWHRRGNNRSCFTRGPVPEGTIQGVTYSILMLRCIGQDGNREWLLDFIVGGHWWPWQALFPGCDGMNALLRWISQKTKTGIQSGSWR